MIRPAPLTKSQREINLYLALNNKNIDMKPRLKPTDRYRHLIQICIYLLDEISYHENIRDFILSAKYTDMLYRLFETKTYGMYDYEHGGVRLSIRVFMEMYSGICGIPNKYGYESSWGKSDDDPIRQFSYHIKRCVYKIRKSTLQNIGKRFGHMLADVAKK